MAKGVLPSSVNKSLNMKVIDDLIAERYSNLDLSIVMMTMIDTAPAAALPYLAIEYGILGYRGWKFADTDDKKREMLKQAYELHRYRGTPWAIKNALKMVGIIGGVTIQENLVICYDGSWTFNGHVYYGRHYAYFRVIIDIANLNSIPVDDIRGIIDAYKRETQWLFNVGFKVDAAEVITIGETSEMAIDPDLGERFTIKENFSKAIVP